MVEEINRYIQRKRQSQDDQRSAVHIVTSESAAGSLRVALQHPKTVIGFPDAFSIGPLWRLDEKVGQRTRIEWLYENINDEQEDGQYEHKLNNILREIEDITDHTPIYIWTGNNADEQTGLRFYLYLLRGKSNEIYLMKATEEGEDIFHTGQIESESLRKAFDDNKEKKSLTEKERLQFQREWEELAGTKDVLRLWEGDEIKRVPADHYDPLILEVIEKLHSEQETKDFIHTGSVIGEVLVDMDAYIDFYFLEYRIRHLVYSGALELKGIPKSVRHYRVKLR